MTMFLLELRIERNDTPESFAMPDDGSILSSTPTSPRHHVVATVLDTDRDTVLSYEFWSMVDPSRSDFDREGRITIKPTSEQLERLRHLRDELDEILEERND
jgi:hypothetical protein